MSKLSKTGLVFTIIYVITTAIVFFYAFTCHGDFCGVVGLIPIMPWPSFFEIFGNSLSRLPASIIYAPYIPIFFALVNAVILYYFGKGCEIAFKKLKHKKSSIIQPS